MTCLEIHVLYLDCISFRAGEVRSTGDIHPLYTIGLHNEENITPSQLKAQILELMDIFLGKYINYNNWFRS